MKGFTESVLIGLLLSVTLARAEGPIGDYNSALNSEGVPGLIPISLADRARLRTEAKQRIRSLVVRGPDPDSLVEAIRAEANPVVREAQWSAWLDQLASAGEWQAGQVEALAELAESAPVAGIPHHDFPSRTVPAFALAPRSAVQIARHARSRRADELVSRPVELAEALEGQVGSRDFAAGLEALASVPSELLAETVEMQLQRTPLAAGPSRILLRAAELSPAQLHLLPELVRRGEVTAARRALQLAIQRDAPQLQEVAGVALSRSELGGLALTAATHAGMHPDQFCWALLGDPALGADAARMLADRSEKLLEEIALRVNDASAIARLRMLLALRLRDSDPARLMLQELARAQWLSEQQRREVLSWL